jgi:hypothetical protein
MDKKYIAFLLLLGVLLVAQYYAHEAFTLQDCSGSDCSGANITISVGTLMALLGKNLSKDDDEDDDNDASGSNVSWWKRKGTVATTKSQAASDSLDAQFVTDLKGVVRDELSKERTVMIGQELVGGGTYGGGADCAAGGGCGGTGSFADAQGQAFLTTAPGKNPNDYIRKDSIPCWGCSVP